MDDYKAPKKMKQIGELFDRYKTHFKAPQATVEKLFTESVYEVTGMKIKQEDVSYTVSTKTISLQLSSLIKSELKLREREILNNLKNKIGDGESPKVIF